jgi:hypothetical protein
MDIKQFLLNNEECLSEYFTKIKVNNDKVEIKAGGNEKGFGITFFIKGDLNDSITSFEDKVNALFNTDSIDNLDYLNEYSNEIKAPYRFITQSPFLKISDEPSIYAFRLSVKQTEESEKS